jgi:site-specific DNA-methyltransferase (adenine-specific)
MKDEQFYTISETAKKLGVSKQTLRRWDNNGKFTSRRHPINNYRVYSSEQITGLVAELESQDYLNYNEKRIEDLESFFTTKLGRLYNCDANTFLKAFPDSSIGLIFADPPYNIKKAEWDTFESQKQYIDWSLKWIRESHRILTDNGSLYVCGFSEILADIKWAASSLFKGCKWLVWYYRNKANMGNDWGRSHESILHLRKTKDFIFNIDMVRIPYNEHTLRYPTRPQAVTSQYGNGKKFDWSPHPLGAKPKDVLEIPTISNKSWERYNHPTQKPVELLRKIILSSSNIDSVIVDPFGGSGTTFAVAEAYGRRWYGSEIDNKYCEEIKNRVSDSTHIARIYSELDQVESEKRRLKLRGGIQ